MACCEKRRFDSSSSIRTVRTMPAMEGVVREIKNIDYDVELEQAYYRDVQCDRCKAWVVVQFVSGWGFCPKCMYKIIV